MGTKILTSFLFIYLSLGTFSEGYHNFENWSDTTSNVITIMPFGDSLTNDSRGRVEFWNQMVASGYTIDFVGSQSQNSSIPDPDHEGVGGRTIEEGTEVINDLMQTYDPQYVLMLLGTNDFAWYFPQPGGISEAEVAQNIALEHQALVQQILDSSPSGTTVVVSTIPKMTSSNVGQAGGDRDKVRYELNILIRNYVQEMRSNGKQVILSDFDRDLILVDDIAGDGVHLTSSGYTKLGQSYHRSLINELEPINTSDAWINEIHYDNNGADEGEFIEVVIKNASIFNLSDLTVSLYNGADATVYGSESLDNFAEGSTVGDYTFYYWQPESLQNDNEGIALDLQGNVFQFISYEGTIAAVDGPASGMTSEDIGVNETGSTSAPIGYSLQLTGAGYSYTDFVWNGPSNESPGDLNSGQFLFPTIEFITSSGTAGEDGSGIDIGIKISNPADYAVNVDVEFQQNQSTAEAVDFSGSTIQMVSFGTGASEGDIRYASFILNNDSNFEGTEKAEFILSNITSAGTAEVVGQSQFTLNIVDDETPNVVINEIHADPDAVNGDADGNGNVSSDDDEFIEIVNAEAISVDITGWTISDAQGVKYTFSENTILPANGAALVFGGSTSSGHFGGAIVQNASSLGFNNEGDTVSLADAFGNIIDTYTYGSEGGDDQSLVRSPDITGNFVKHTEASESSGTLFSPGTRSDGSIFSTTMVLEGTAGWRMLSAPVENMPVSEILDDVPIQGFDNSDDKNFYTGYDGSSFTAPTDLSGNLNSGEGFILYVFNNNEFSSSTLPVYIDVGTNSEPSGDVTVPLHANGDQWNLLGNPYQTAFDITSIIPAGGSLGSTVGHIWSNTEGSYILTSSNDDKVAPGQGFLIQNSETTPASSVTFPVSGKTSGTRFYKSAETRGFVQLTLLSENKADGNIQQDLSTVLYFHENAEVGKDAFDAEKLYPLKQAYSLLGFISPDTDVLMAQDSRPYFGEGEEHFEVGINANNVKPDQTIKWEKAVNIPEEWNFLFIDNQTGEEIIMDENFNYSFQFEDQTMAKITEPALVFDPGSISKMNSGSRFTIVLNRGTATSNQSNSTVPKQFYLEQNYPNPFNPVTQIRYDVATQSRVSIEVFNLMGQRVATIVDQVKSPGTYRTVWNASTLASGVYYYRFKAGNTVMTRKMTLIK